MNIAVVVGDVDANWAAGLLDRWHRRVDAIALRADSGDALDRPVPTAERVVMLAADSRIIDGSVWSHLKLSHPAAKLVRVRGPACSQFWRHADANVDLDVPWYDADGAAGIEAANNNEAGNNKAGTSEAGNSEARQRGSDLRGGTGVVAVVCRRRRDAVDELRTLALSGRVAVHVRNTRELSQSNFTEAWWIDPPPRHVDPTIRHVRIVTPPITEEHHIGVDQVMCQMRR